MDLWQYVDEDKVERVPDSDAVTHILPKEGETASVLAQARTIPHVTVYTKEEIPEKYRYTHHRRIMPIVVEADEGWILTPVSFTSDLNIKF